MKEWTKKQKITAVAVFVAILAVLAVLAGVLNRKTVESGGKNFTLEVVSKRDSYFSTAPYRSEAEYLGEFLRTLEKCEWQDSEYGIYITGFDGMSEDMDNQYWWCIMVNGESATAGADEIPLQDGETYSLVLTQGW